MLARPRAWMSSGWWPQEERIDALLATGSRPGIGERRAARPPTRSGNASGPADARPLPGGPPGRGPQRLPAAREVLADELGIDPSPELARLHERILSRTRASTFAENPSVVTVSWTDRRRSDRRRVQGNPASRGPRRGRQDLPRADRVRPRFVRASRRRPRRPRRSSTPTSSRSTTTGGSPGARTSCRATSGGSLATAVGSGRLQTDRALLVVDQIASALGFAHRHGSRTGTSGLPTCCSTASGTPISPTSHRDRTAPEPVDDIRDLASLVRRTCSRTVRRAIEELIERAQRGRDAAARRLPGPRVRSSNPRRRTSVSPLDVRNPYKGLRAFTAADSRDFFGTSRAHRTARVQDGRRGRRRQVPRGGRSERQR